MIEYLRLAFGTILVLLPGLALGRTVSEVLAWTMGAVFAAWAVVFAVHSNIRLAVILMAVLLVVAVVARRRRGLRVPRATLVVGTVLGWFLWHVAGAVVGDGLFHEGRVRKLVELGDLHLRTVDEFKDGGLHPGYAFPLWHGFDALVAWLSGLDPEVVMRHESSLLAPIALAVAYEAGEAVFASRFAGFSVALAQVAIFCFGPGHGGSWAVLSQPGSASRQLLVPAAVALFFRRELLPTAIVFGALALVHPTYAVFLLIPLLPLVVREWRAYAAAAVPVGAALLWLRPLLQETSTHTPSHTQRVNDLAQYRDQLVIENTHHFRLAAEVFGRSGAIAVAALILLPLCALAWRRRFAPFVVGGSLLILSLMLIPWLFVHFSDAASLSQSRRAAGFLPFPFVFAAGLAVAMRRVWIAPAALAAGIAVQLEWPGDFDYGLRHGGPAAATWIALFGGAAVLLVALVLRLELAPRFGHGALAAALFALPVLVHGAGKWTPASPTDPHALSPRLVHNLRTRVPKGAIVLAPIQTSYEISAVAPVYVVAGPLTHVANTKANRARERYDAVKHWVLTNDPRVAERYGATWQVRAGRLTPVG
ncbi:MAG TPA: hypothetical protein VFU51_06680 [Gaiellaceae bacterium]|nr:hypothetical protein [Gaiellaceae bacterium]